MQRNSSMDFIWTGLENVDEALIRDFDCGDYVFNDFLKENAIKWRDKGEAVTYLCVDDEKAPSRVYAYATVNANGLLYKGEDSKNNYIHCAEIRLFAIAKALRSNGDPTRNYSEIIFKRFLQELYYMSLNVIGFDAIFLAANENGYGLYKKSGFVEIEEFIAPESNESEGCTPLLLVMNSQTIDSFYDN